MTIKGVKNHLKGSSTLHLDDSIKNIVNNYPHKSNKIKEKINKITRIIKELKKLKDG